MTSCWHHFGEATFSLIEELPMSPIERYALEVGFFGREIDDIIGNSEENRSERHEPTKTWLHRLEEAHFSPTDLSNGGDKYKAFSEGPVKATVHKGYVALEYRGEALVSVICAHGKPGQSAAIASAAPSSSSASQARQQLLAGANADTNSLDGRALLRALAFIAWLDGKLDISELRYMKMQAHLLGVDNAVSDAIDAAANGSVTLEQVIEPLRGANVRTKKSVIRDCIVLARVDGSFDRREKEVITSLAQQLGIGAAELKLLEQEADCYNVNSLGGAQETTNFKLHWALFQKGEH